MHFKICKNTLGAGILMRTGQDRTGQDRTGRDGTGREGKGREGKGREGKGWVVFPMRDKSMGRKDS